MGNSKRKITKILRKEKWQRCVMDTSVSKLDLCLSGKCKIGVETGFCCYEL